MKKYMRVVSNMEQQIADGVYRPGGKLPSVRQAAKEYGCSISTITRAYAELERKHAIYAISQSGFYVVGSKQEEHSWKEGDSINFSASSPDVHVFPYLDFQHCLNQAIDTYKYHLFTYGESQGLAKLRQTLVAHLANDQVFAKAEQMVITSGIQQALEILAKIPFPNEQSVILVEQPSYNNYLNFLEKKHIPVQGITRTVAGIDLRKLEERFRSGKIKFFYTMSRYHNPLGTSLSTEERKAIAKLASQYDVYVVEDDYMADLGDKRGFDPIYAYNTTGHVIYLKSFSKIIFPGLRLGAVVLPKHLLEAFQSDKSYNTSLLSQAALEVYIQNGMYERHRRTIYGQYRARMHLLLEAVQRHNHAGLIQVSPVQEGVYCQFKLPQTVNVERLIKRLSARKINVVSGKKFYLTSNLEQEKFLRISIARAKLEQIETGVQAIIEEVR